MQCASAFKFFNDHVRLSFKFVSGLHSNLKILKRSFISIYVPVSKL